MADWYVDMTIPNEVLGEARTRLFLSDRFKGDIIDFTTDIDKSRGYHRYSVQFGVDDTAREDARHIVQMLRDLTPEIYGRVLDGDDSRFGVFVETPSPVATDILVNECSLKLKRSDTSDLEAYAGFSSQYEASNYAEMIKAIAGRRRITLTKLIVDDVRGEMWSSDFLKERKV